MNQKLSLFPKDLLLHKIGFILKNLNFQSVLVYKCEISLDIRKKIGLCTIFNFEVFWDFFPPNPSVFRLVALLHNGDDHIILSRCLHFIGYKVYTLK